VDPEASVAETEVVSEVDLCLKGPQPVLTVCNTPRQEEAQVAGIQKEDQYPQCSNLNSNNNNNNNKPSGDRYNTWKRHVVS
jgi:hypothetical protein